jgi:hypothetical protein
MAIMEQFELVIRLFYKILYEVNEIDLCDILRAEKCEKYSCA